MTPLVLLIGGTALFASLLMAALYLVQRVSGDAGIVDAGWAGGLGAVALAYALFGPGDAMRRVLLALVACTWSFRLAFHILRDRVLAGGEDGRYQRLREHWGARAQRNFFLFFQAQAGLILLFSVPFLMVALQETRPAGVLDLAGPAVGLGAIAGESVADRQLRRWRRDPANRGKTCRGGLWRYSRHPNYFFEWLHWWAYVLLAASWPHVAGALAGPVVMLAFLYRLTGIPHTEQQALRSRGDDYRAYQRATSAFFPWPPKNTRP